MKKITLLFALPFLLFSIGLFITGCQKETNEIKSEDASIARSDNSGGCRLTQYYYYNAIHDIEQVDNFTYKNGLLDELTASYGWVYKMQYHPNGKMKSALVYADEDLLFTIDFIYEKGKIVKEIWYLENTNVVDDEVINTYNEKGQLIKNESINYDYYTTYTYHNDGSVADFTLYFSDVLFLKGEYTSNQKYKNPYRSVRGLEYLFTYSNGGLFSGPWWYSSERWTFYDENGTPSVHYDLDPSQTIWTPALQNYPQQAVYTDLLSGGIVTNSFTYENCIPGESSRASLRLANPVNRINNDESLKAILTGPKTDLAKRIDAFRSKSRTGK